MDTNIKYVVDASYLGTHLLPDEQNEQITRFFREYTDGNILIFAPSLLQYEVANIVLNAVLQKRLYVEDSLLVLDSFLGMDIHYFDVSFHDVLNIACERHISCYDASYLWLAESLSIPLLTLDKKLQKLSV